MMKERAVIKFKSKGLISHKRDGSRKKTGDDLFPKKMERPMLESTLFDFNDTMYAINSWLMHMVFNLDAWERKIICMKIFTWF